MNCNNLIFSSITSPSLIATKFLLRKFKDIKVLVVPHIVLDSITEVPRSRCDILVQNMVEAF